MRGGYILYRIIFFDVDGTLRNEKFGVLKTTKTALKLCRENGYLICLCTGRNIGMITDDVLNIKPDGVIAGGGSYIQFQKCIIKNSFFPPKNIELAFDYLKQQNKETAFAFETNSKIFMNDIASKILKKLTKIKLKELNIKQKNYMLNSEKIIYENNINCFNPLIDEVNKICLWSHESIFENLKAILSKKQIQVCQQYPYEFGNYYEIIQSDCNKGQAIINLCKYLNIPIQHTMAFGDGKNDIDMLKTAGTSIAMKDGDDEAIYYADTVCEESENDGIFNELKRRKII